MRVIHMFSPFTIRLPQFVRTSLDAIGAKTQPTITRYSEKVDQFKSLVTVNPHRLVSFAITTPLVAGASYRLSTDAMKRADYRILLQYSPEELSTLQHIDLCWLNDFITMPAFASFLYLFYAVEVSLVHSISRTLNKDPVAFDKEQKEYLPGLNKAYRAMMHGFNFSMILFCVYDEFTQMTSPSHTFDPGDIVAYLLGGALTAAGIQKLYYK